MLYGHGDIAIGANGLTPGDVVLVDCALSFEPMTHVPRYVPARTNDGWSVVGLVLLVVTACIVATVVIHKRTYKHPTDPTMRAAGSRAEAGAPGH